MITPKEAQEITPEEKETIRQLESGIDEVILRDSKNNITHHSFGIPYNSDIACYRVLNEIAKKYAPHYEVRIDFRKSPTHIFLDPKKNQ